MTTMWMGQALYAAAVEHYQSCIEQADAEPLDWFLKQLRPVCVAYQQAAEEAQRSLQ